MVLGVRRGGQQPHAEDLAGLTLCHLVIKSTPIVGVEFEFLLRWSVLKWHTDNGSFGKAIFKGLSLRCCARRKARRPFVSIIKHRTSKANGSDAKPENNSSRHRLQCNVFNGYFPGRNLIGSRNLKSREMADPALERQFKGHRSAVTR